MIDVIKKLREKTGAGMMDCKNALKDAEGDVDRALDILRKKGLARAKKKSSRTTKAGLIHSYIHMGGKIGVLVEVNCETDFVARNDEFKAFVKDIAMQIAASHPSFVKREDVPQGVIDKEKEIIEAQIQESGGKKKPPQIMEKIVTGKLDKYYEEVCLLEQPFIKDPEIKINDLLTSLIAKIGENISIRRFVRYQLGEEETGL
ncbi:MAG: translation elongation factor Ts [Candidatus Omnitrophica bacterium]|nr:translation elongation factor Ts [Candidatus Omnitrophota bacterium]